MKKNIPFGFINGIATATSFVPLIIAMILAIVLKWKVNTMMMLILPTIVTKALGDWLFWDMMFPQEIDSKTNNNWRSSISSILFSHHSTISSLFDLFVDAIMDIFLIYTALKIPVNPIWIFLVFVGCQAIAAPFQGILLMIFKRKNIRKFSMIIIAIATLIALELNGIIKNVSYLGILGLSSFAIQTQMLIVLGAKCMLTGTSVSAKANIAEVIKIETFKKFNNL